MKYVLRNDKNYATLFPPPVSKLMQVIFLALLRPFCEFLVWIADDFSCIIKTFLRIFSVNFGFWIVIL